MSDNELMVLFVGSSMASFVCGFTLACVGVWLTRPKVKAVKK